MTATTMSLSMSPLSVSFNILAYLDRLKEAGMPEPLAKVQAEALQTVMQANDEKNRNELATKGDISDVRGALRETELRLQKEIKDVELRLVTMIEASKHDMIKWYIGMAIAQTGVLAALYAIMK